MKKTHSRLTLEDIAKEIHISRTTIYKVLNQKGTVSEQTRQTVLDALKRYDYVPNNNARNLALNKNYIIGFIDFESPDAAYFAPVIEQGIRQAIQEYGDHGLEVHHYTAPIHQPKQQLLDLKKAFQSGIRHFVISAADPAQMHTALIKLAEAGCTVILLSKDVPDIPFYPFIGVDAYKAGQFAAEVLGKMQPVNGSVQILVAEESSSNITVTQNNLCGFLEQMNHFFPSVRILPIVRHLKDSCMVDEHLTRILIEEQPAAIYDLTYRLDTISRVLHRENRTDITLVGMDLFPAIVPYLKDRTINAVIFQDLQAQSYLACSLLFEYMCYGKPISQKKYYSKLEIVMSGNLEYFLNFEESAL